MFVVLLLSAVSGFQIMFNFNTLTRRLAACLVIWPNKRSSFLSGEPSFGNSRDGIKVYKNCWCGGSTVFGGSQTTAMSPAAFGLNEGRCDAGSSYAAPEVCRSYKATV